MAFEVVIEIPKGSRIKYEIDHETNAVWLDRVLFTSRPFSSDMTKLPTVRALT